MRANDPKQDKAGNCMRKLRADYIGKIIKKHRKGNQPSCELNDPIVFEKRIDADFYTKLYSSDGEVREELYWTWEELHDLKNENEIIKKEIKRMKEEYDKEHAKKHENNSGTCLIGKTNY